MHNALTLKNTRRLALAADHHRSSTTHITILIHGYCDTKERFPKHIAQLLE
ncbi:MAG: hypothetical protein HC945_03655, partial [Nitrosarchaeum sp.]|nr:hypothetical protein [Nitrosarchaeum sp.]